LLRFVAEDVENVPPAPSQGHQRPPPAVEDLDAAIAFFVELGMELEGRAEVEGLVADQCTGLDGVRCDIAMLRTPDGHSRLELAKYRSPAAISARSEPSRR
jgi:catechol 2,3-dioxygenase-like lactoylglutathione lyase family enzyme